MSTDKKQPTAAAIAKVRRSGATWSATREQLDVRWNSTKFAAVLREGGFDPGGTKLDGSGPESKARFHREAVSTKAAK
jgi:hypothetical protein